MIAALVTGLAVVIGFALCTLTLTFLINAVAKHFDSHAATFEEFMVGWRIVSLCAFVLVLVSLGVGGLVLWLA